MGIIWNLVFIMKNRLPSLLLGFISLSFQILLMREFSANFFGNEITFGLLLASWLLWGGLGSISAQKFEFSQKIFSKLYYAVILLFPLCLICLRFSRIFSRTLPGEMTGIFPILIFSLLLSFCISFPLGILFVFNTSFLKRKISRVYLLESIGASTGGLAVYFFLIPFFSNWQATAIVGILASIVIFFSFGEKRERTVFIFSLIFLGVFYCIDFPSQKFFWKPFQLTQSKDTPYGKLQVLKTAEQINLYNNNLLIYSYPNPAGAEETIHFALLQNPQAGKVLLIGGGGGGSLKEVLKYPQVEIDLVEIDPEIIQFSIQYLPEDARDTFQNNRIHIFYEDGRAYLTKTQKKYDIIILNLPEPTSAQINRFYTKEFFVKSREKLNENGIFSFRIPSAENYISTELKTFLASLFYSLKEVFPVIKIVPGQTNIFLASSSPLSLDYKELSKKIEELNLRNNYVSPELLFSRLDPQRISHLRAKIESVKKIINRDLFPVSYFYHSVLWSSQFKSGEAKIFSFFGRIEGFWLEDFPLLLFLGTLFIFGFKAKKTSFFLIPLAVTGLTTVVIEIIVILSFQTFFGYLYQKIALLLASFMVGLSLGAFMGKRGKKQFKQVLFVQSGFIFFLFLLRISIAARPPEFLFFLFLHLFGFLGGYLFVVANELYLKEKSNYGIGYGLDLIGSFIGALVASSLLIPLVGLPALLKSLIFLNSICFLFTLWGLKFR